MNTAESRLVKEQDTQQKAMEAMNTAYDIVMREEDFVLYADGHPFRTPSGIEVAHANARLLRQAVAHELLPDGNDVTPLSLLIRWSEHRTGQPFLFPDRLLDRLVDDPLLQHASSRSADLAAWMMLEDFPFADFAFLQSSSLASAVEAFLCRKADTQTVVEYCAEYVARFSAEQQLALQVLAVEHGGGLLVHLLCLAGYISLQEYAQGLSILHCRESCSPASASLPEAGVGALRALQARFMAQAQTVVDFLTLCKSENQISVIEALIEKGEDDQTEFKSTLRWDLRQGMKNAAIEHAALKTLCAFLNTGGGDLLLGVRDDGSVQGIETDGFENDDRFLLHLWTLIKTCMGQEMVEWVKTSLQKFGDKTVCRISCKASRKPVFLNQKGFPEEFFIRVGPSSSSLEISSALKYIQQHFC